MKGSSDDKWNHVVQCGVSRIALGVAQVGIQASRPKLNFEELHKEYFQANRLEFLYKVRIYFYLFVNKQGFQKIGLLSNIKYNGELYGSGEGVFDALFASNYERIYRSIYPLRWVSCVTSWWRACMKSAAVRPCHCRWTQAPLFMGQTTMILPLVLDWTSTAERQE